MLFLKSSRHKICKTISKIFTYNVSIYLYLLSIDIDFVNLDTQQSSLLSK